MADYQQVKLSFLASPSISPLIPTPILPYLAFVLLALTFGLTFYFTTLPKHTIPLREVAVASTASILGGFGIVALFCSVGVYV